MTGTAWEVQQLAPRLSWHTIRLRPNERGYLQADFARCRVWVRYGTTSRQEWLLIRKDAVQVTYSLSIAPEETPLETMAWRKTHRYLIERSNEDAKGEIGWDPDPQISRLATSIGLDHSGGLVCSRYAPGLDAPFLARSRPAGKIRGRTLTPIIVW